ncbi:cytochrome P450 [Pseudoneurospora amorphoporcata]|uniref:Cytochrome P450 n=1 Tax=Pseudoneurospora amorphoporcata TaxID=241081 RepID=A0AAN6NZ34_9PEZI|nr:cytochrome P450 [Pseudoneurospora amorphoporcata]
MSAWLMHHDPVAFGNGKGPTVFDPERWIPLSQKDEERIRMQERCMVPFGKGSRNCLGQALAMAELYSTLGNIFWPFDDLVVEEGVTREDLGLVELFLGYHPREARKLRILRGKAV